MRRRKEENEKPIETKNDDLKISENQEEESGKHLKEDAGKVKLIQKETENNIARTKEKNGIDMKQDAQTVKVAQNVDGNEVLEKLVENGKNVKKSPGKAKNIQNNIESKIATKKEPHMKNDRQHTKKLVQNDDGKEKQEDGDIEMTEDPGKKGKKGQHIKEDIQSVKPAQKGHENENPALKGQDAYLTRHDAGDVKDIQRDDDSEEVNGDEQVVSNNIELPISDEKAFKNIKEATTTHPSGIELPVHDQDVDESKEIGKKFDENVINTKEISHDEKQYESDGNPRIEEIEEIDSGVVLPVEDEGTEKLEVNERVSNQEKKNNKPRKNTNSKQAENNEGSLSEWSSQSEESSADYSDRSSSEDYYSRDESDISSSEGSYTEGGSYIERSYTDSSYTEESSGEDSEVYYEDRRTTEFDCPSETEGNEEGDRRRRRSVNENKKVEKVLQVVAAPAFGNTTNTKASKPEREPTEPLESSYDRGPIERKLWKITKLYNWKTNAIEEKQHGAKKNNTLYNWNVKVRQMPQQKKQTIVP